MAYFAQLRAYFEAHDIAMPVVYPRWSAMPVETKIRKVLDKFGVEVARVAKDMSPLKQVYEPDNPYANDKGFVEYPNVNLSAEMVNLLSAQRAYEANIAVITAGRTMGARAMRIIGA